MNLNKVMFAGFVGQDPEIKHFDSNCVASFSLASTEVWKDKNGEKQSRTEWANCVVFGKRAETIEKYVFKGSGLFVEGRLQTDSYEKDGVKRFSTKINVSDFKFVGGKSNDSQPRQQSGSVDPEKLSNNDDSDDLPF